MQPPPIASPHGETEQPLSKRVEWNPASGCFRLRAHSTLGGRFRCEFKGVRFKPGNLIAVTVLFPLFALLLIATQYGHLKKRVTVIEVWAEGLRLVTPEQTKLVRWRDLKRVELWGQDLFLVMGGAESIFSAREGYLNADESNKMFAILHGLWESNGANWPDIVTRFGRACERSLI